MSDEYSISAKITADDTGFQAAFDRAESGLKGWGINLDTFYNKGASVFKSFGIDIDQMASKLGTSGPMLTAWAGVGVVVAQVAAQVAAKMLEVGKKFDETSSIIAKATGASGQALDDLNDSFQKIALGGLEADLNDVAGAVGELNTRLGSTGKMLEDQVKIFESFADITGGEIKTAVTDVIRLMAKWDVDAKDLNITLDQLAKAGQVSGISVSALTTQLTTSGTALKNMGLSLTESIALLASFEQNGVRSETVMAGLNAATAKFSSVGVNAADGFKVITEAIKNAGDETEATRIAVETFGMRAGPELASAIRSGKADLDAWVQSIASAEGTVNKTDEASNTLGDNMKKMGSALSAAFAPIGEVFVGIAKKVTDVLIPTITVIGEVLAVLVDTFKSVFNISAKIFSGFFDIIAGIFTGDWERVWNGTKRIVLSAVKGILDTVSVMVNGVNFIVNGLIDGINAVITKVGLPAIGKLQTISYSAILGIDKAIADTYKTTETTVKSSLKTIGEAYVANTEGIAEAEKKLKDILSGMTDEDKKAAEESAETAKKEAERKAALAEDFRREMLTEQARRREDIERRSAELKLAGVSEIEIAQWVSAEKEKLEDEYRKYLIDTAAKNIAAQAVYDEVARKSQKNLADQELAMIQEKAKEYQVNLDKKAKAAEDSARQAQKSESDRIAKEEEERKNAEASWKATNDRMTAEAEKVSAERTKILEDFRRERLTEQQRQLEDIDKLAEARINAGADEAEVAQWVASEKEKIEDEYRKFLIETAATNIAIQAAYDETIKKSEQTLADEELEMIKAGAKAWKEAQEKKAEDAKAAAELTRQWQAKASNDELVRLRFERDAAIAEATKLGIDTINIEKYYADQEKVILNERVKSAKEMYDNMRGFGTQYYSEATKKEEEFANLTGNIFDNIANGIESAISKAFDNIKKDADDWSDVVGSVFNLVETSVVGAFETLGTMLVTGEANWSDWGRAALRALAEVLRSLGAQLIALSVVHALRLDFVGAGIALAGAVAAYVAAGVAESFADTSEEAEQAAEKVKTFNNTLNETNAELEKNKSLFTDAGKSADAYASILTKVKSSASSFYESLQDVGSTIASELVNNLSDGLGESDFLSTLRDYITEMVVQAAVFTESLSAEIASIGKMIADGIANGMDTATITTIKNRLADLYATAAAAASQVTGIVASVFPKTAAATSIIGEYLSIKTGYAGGTNYVPTTGQYKVGELGPEIVTLPQGSKVTNNFDSSRTSKTQTIQINQYSPKALDANESRKMTIRAMRDLAFDGVSL